MEATTGDTLCDPDKPIILNPLIFLLRLLSLRSSLKLKPIKKKWSGLGKLGGEDPSLRLSVDEETGQTTIAGMGELHLEIIVDRLKREFFVEANVGKPQVAYRETITKRLKAKVSTLSKPVVVGNMDTFGCVLSLTRLVRALYLPAKSSVDLFQKNIFLLLKKALKRRLTRY